MREPTAAPPPIPAFAPVLRPLLEVSEPLPPPPLLLLLPLPSPETGVVVGELFPLFSVVVDRLSRIVVSTLFTVTSTDRTSGVSVIVDVVVVVRFALTTDVTVCQNVV
jgi:hypothetical protein